MAVPETDERGSDCETRESSSSHDETHTEEKLEDKFARRQG